MTIFRRVAGIAGSALWAAAAAAQASIPADGHACRLSEPPIDSGAYATPGGFLLVYPRNAGITPDYTGCKTIWVARGPRETPLVMRLYFSRGRLGVAEAHDVGTTGAPLAVCAATSKVPKCAGLHDNPLAALKLPTWPRACMEQPELAVCRGEPN